MKRVSIIGIGWLGSFIAKSLTERGYLVFGTVRSDKKKKELQKYTECVEKYALGDDLELNAELNSIAEVGFFVLTIPPSGSVEYEKEVSELIDFLLKKSPTAAFIYLSSTSVYGEQAGMISEKSSILPITTNAVKIVAVEEKIKKIKNNSILRLGGLVGGERHPAYYLSGKESSRSNTPVNLVHQEDIVRLINGIIEDEIPYGLYNVCSPDHPFKATYYKWVAQQKKIPPPYFLKEEEKMDKVVTCEALKETNFQFKYQSPYDFPI